MRAALFASWGLMMVGMAAATVSAQDAMPVVYADDFENGMDRWEPFDAKSFEITEVKNAAGETTHALRALGTSKFQPKFRSPPNIAMLKDATVSDFELTAKVQSTNPTAGPHRDMCIVFCYQDPTHFYYVHFGALSDPNACQIFIVDDAARTPITVKTVQGTPWTDGWQNVKVVRVVETGEIEVYFNDMDEPFMTAKDTKFKWGRVGLGTFDDNGNWDDFELRGVATKPDGEPAGG
jgi:hypothetical protein